MSEHLLQLISTNRENLTPIQEDEWQLFIMDQQKNNIKEHLIPFFVREMILFDLEKVNLNDTIENPFTEDNVNAVNEMLFYIDRVLGAFERGPLHVRAQLSFIAEKIIPA